MGQQLIERPVILAICGKSAAGKTTLAKWLVGYFSSLGVKSHYIISMTTRPRRSGEIHKQDYYFVSDFAFTEFLNTSQLLEHTTFKKWHYGTSLSEIKPKSINIGVFNTHSFRSLMKYKYKYIIIPIYIDTKLKYRLSRSKEREGHWRLEFFRRAITDYFDFKDIQKKLKYFNNGEYIKLDGVENIWRQARTVERALVYYKVLIRQNGSVRLGNFV